MVNETSLKSHKNRSYGGENLRQPQKQNNKYFISLFLQRCRNVPFKSFLYVKPFAEAELENVKYIYAMPSI